ncbi:hypothetical protein GOODEAATRI_034450 [Goodea atripinnis]|uniref:Uncharacterized protein n=1 Tax=Goodea atripinnis TaxID=208336 RepID=A0ABV0PJC3_9TELE
MQYTYTIILSVNISPATISSCPNKECFCLFSSSLFFLLSLLHQLSYNIHLFLKRFPNRSVELLYLAFSCLFDLHNIPVILLLALHNIPVILQTSTEISSQRQIIAKPNTHIPTPVLSKPPSYTVHFISHIIKPNLSIACSNISPF